VPLKIPGAEDLLAIEGDNGTAHPVMCILIPTLVIGILIPIPLMLLSIYHDDLAGSRIGRKGVGDGLRLALFAHVLLGTKAGYLHGSGGGLDILDNGNGEVAAGPTVHLNRDGVILREMDTVLVVLAVAVKDPGAKDHLAIEGDLYALYLVMVVGIPILYYEGSYTGFGREGVGDCLRLAFFTDVLLGTKMGHLRGSGVDEKDP
jgi:hypothetical protein